MSETAMSGTSRRRRLEQDRAKAAWGAIEQVKSHRCAGDYASLAKGAPADIQTNGLGQTLAFLRAKGYERGRPKSDSAHVYLLDHLARWLRVQLKLAENQDMVEWVAVSADTGAYRRATAEALAYLAWLRRFAEAELGDATTGEVS